MYDFDKQINRLDSDSIKWNALEQIYGTSDLLPMWVADMDFLSPSQITQALIHRAEHGIFGYGFLPEHTNHVIKNWVKKRYHWEIDEEWLVPSAGVVNAIAMAIQSLTNVGDRILIQTPVYHPFYSIIENNQRIIVKNPLLFRNGKYTMDFHDFEEKLKSGVKLFILCSPHNPVGRVWTKQELEKIRALCEKYHVPVISDEIHADIIYKPHQHTPLASIDKNFQHQTITCIAPSKTFNIPGLQASMMIIPDETIREKVKATQAKIGFFGLNIMANTALWASYKYGEEWLEALLIYLQKNRDLTIQYIQRELPQINVIEPEGTYLIWIDCRGLKLNDREIQKLLVQKGKLALEPGGKYGTEGEGFVRMNIACPRSTLTDGLNRLKTAFT